MFVTRATRHDKRDLQDFYEEHGLTDQDLERGTSFIARDGRIVGALRVVEVEPRTLVIDGVLVREDRRNEGIGRRLVQAALNSRGGTVYLCCHEERLPFYGHLGFSEVDVQEAPPPVRSYWESNGDYPTPPGHEHFYLKAR